MKKKYHTMFTTAAGFLALSVLCGCLNTPKQANIISASPLICLVPVGGKVPDNFPDGSTNAVVMSYRKFVQFIEKVEPTRK